MAGLYRNGEKKGGVVNGDEDGAIMVEGRGWAMVSLMGVNATGVSYTFPLAIDNTWSAGWGDARESHVRDICSHPVQPARIPARMARHDSVVFLRISSVHPMPVPSVSPPTNTRRRFKASRC